MQTELQRQHARHTAFHAHIARVAARINPPAAPVLRIVRAPPVVPVQSVQTALPLEVPYELLTVWAYFPYGEPAVPRPRDFPPRSEEIIRVVAKHFGVKVADLTGPYRWGYFVLPRQVAIYLCRRMTKLSFPQIGRKFGGRDHTTALHAFNKVSFLIENRMKRYGFDVACDVDQLFAKLSEA